MPSTAAAPPSNLAARFPATVLFDQREKLPYAFTELRADKYDGSLPLLVPTRSAFLNTGDYTLDGFAAQVAVERKSLSDLYSTLGQQRLRFENELARLDDMPFADVIVEASLGTTVTTPPAYSRLRPKTVMRSVIAWRYRFPRIHWHFVDDRRLAEVLTLRLLERYWWQVVCGGKRTRLEKVELTEKPGEPGIG